MMIVVVVVVVAAVVVVFVVVVKKSDDWKNFKAIYKRIFLSLSLSRAQARTCIGNT